MSTRLHTHSPKSSACIVCSRGYHPQRVVDDLLHIGDHDGSEVFRQQVINGFTIGSYLALIALGYTMVYGLIELINFAHGDIYMLGFFFSLSFLGLLGATSTLSGFTLLWMSSLR